MLVLAWLIFAFASVIGLLTTRWIGGELTGRCGTCHYDLMGLPESSRCPECGGNEREVSMHRSKLVVRRLAFRVWLLALALLVGASVVVPLLRIPLLELEYVAEGFSLVQARAAIPLRHDADPTRFCTPFVIAAAALPLFARLDTLSRWRWVRHWLLGAAVLSVLPLANALYPTGL